MVLMAGLFQRAEVSPKMLGTLILQLAVQFSAFRNAGGYEVPHPPTAGSPDRSHRCGRGFSCLTTQQDRAFLQISEKCS